MKSPETLTLARGAPPTYQEQEILRRVAQALPDTPFSGVWGPLEMFTPNGEALEIDLVALGFHALYVIEVKVLRGALSGDERAWTSRRADGAIVVFDRPLQRCELVARMLKSFLAQEDPTLAGVPVEPLVFLTASDVELALTSAARRHVVMQHELVKVLQLGAWPGDQEGSAAEPLGEQEALAVKQILDRLRRRRRPGHGTFSEEVALLLRALVIDLEAQARGPERGNAPPRTIEQGIGAAGDVEDAWTRERIEAIASAWVISCAFVCALEERGLSEDVRLSGRGAGEAERRFFTKDPSRTALDFLDETLRAVMRFPAGVAVLGRDHNPLWSLAPSASGAQMVIDFFRRADRRGRPLWSFADRMAESDVWTFLYQDLSDSERIKRTLIETPSFVGEFLVEQTLAPALRELALDDVHVLDPACGSGGLLIAALERLAEARRASLSEPLEASFLRALERIHGMDISPAAVLITRVRLSLFCLDKLGVTRLAGAPFLPCHVVVGDSLLPGAGAKSQEAASMMSQRYAVVLAEPPFAACKDAALREVYRQLYTSVRGKVPLAVPFLERCFQLAVDGGFVGVLTTNSFMKRELGKALVEDVLARVEILRVVDMAGAFIPGHGTPTAILVGRNRRPLQSSIVRVVAAKRGEPTAPLRPEEGKVWSAIAAHFNEADYKDDYIAVFDVAQMRLAKHPWSLVSHEHSFLRNVIEGAGVPLMDRATRIRVEAMSGSDEVFLLPSDAAARLRLRREITRPWAEASSIRDWGVVPDGIALTPYDESDRLVPFDTRAPWGRYLWRYKAVLGSRVALGKRLSEEWWGWARWSPRPRRGAPCLICPIAAGSNHFALAAGDAIYHHAHVIELPPGTSEDEVFALLGYLNSSTAGWWLKLVSASKTQSAGFEGANVVYDFSSVTKAPIPEDVVNAGPRRAEIAALARRLHAAAEERAKCTPELVLEEWKWGSRRSLLTAFAEAEQRDVRLLRRMICDQEDLDWLIYKVIGIAGDESSRMAGSALAEHRPFTWLSDRPPKGIDPKLAALWTRRRQALRQSPLLQLLEAPAFKRPFRQTAADIDDADDAPRGDDSENEGEGSAARGRSSAEEACGRWLLGKIEDVFRTAGPPRCLSLEALTERLAAVDGALAVASVWAGHPHPELPEVVGELLAAHAVPCAAALRHTEAGLAKRAKWEETWALQRSVDAGGGATVAPPPHYTMSDYRDAITWRHRGKLGVPRERFIAYPGAGRKEGELLYGWAGWALREQALVLKVMYEERSRDGWASAPLEPLREGLRELVPWICSWDEDSPL